MPIHACDILQTGPLGLGGVGTIAIALHWMKLLPSLRKVERLE